MDNTYGIFGTCDFILLEEDGIRFNKGEMVDNETREK